MPTFRTVQFPVQQLLVLPNQPGLTLEPSSRLYTQRDRQDVRIDRIGPGVRST
jgi:hypothetical protein